MTATDARLHVPTTGHSGALTPADIRSRPRTPAWTGSGRLAAYSFWKLLTNPFQLGFAIALPIFMYMMFGAGQEYSDMWLGHANVAATVLVNMAVYGVIMTTSSMGANVSLERTSGVSRLFALTPLGSGAQVAARTFAAAGISALVICVDWAIGYATGARMDDAAWLWAGVLLVVMSVLPAAMGLAAGFAIRSDGAFAVTSIFTVVSAFASGMFIPLDQMGGFFRELAPWTPLYGMVQIAQLPLNGWEGMSGGWFLNVAVWTLLFGAVAAWGSRRDTGR